MGLEADSSTSPSPESEYYKSVAKKDPKAFFKYVSSKTKTRVGIGNL
jgi:hypothetical protein